MHIDLYLKAKAARAGITSIRILAEHCNIPPATLYRYARGENIIPPSAEAMIAEALRLSETEKQEFHDIIMQSVTYRPLLKAFQMIDTYIFEGGLPAENIKIADEVLLFDRDRFIVSKEELFERMLIHSGKPNYHCSAKIVHGTGEEYFSQLVARIDNLFQRAKNVAVEHLIYISAKDQTANVKTLLTVLPLLKYEKYALFYSDDANFGRSNWMRNRYIYFYTSYDGEDGRRKEESFLVSVKEFDKSSCLCFSNPMAHEFITDSFFDLRGSYKNSFASSRPLDRVNAVCSKEGLLNMARTGYATGHTEFMAPYTKEEMRAMFENARDRNADEKDAYNLYITEKPILNNNSFIFGYKGESIIFQFGQNSSIVNLNNNLCIINKELGNLFYEYAANYFPKNHALTKKEATAFLDSLIDDCLK